MASIMETVKKIHGGQQWYLINCPACGEHLIAVDPPFSNGAKWKFNGDFVKPTFSPSINIHWQAVEDHPERRCHFHIKAGMISYCGDCTHQYAGQTLPLLPIAHPKPEN